MSKVNILVLSAAFVTLALPVAATMERNPPMQPDPVIEMFSCPPGYVLTIPDGSGLEGGSYRELLINEDGITIKMCNGIRCKNVFAWDLVMAECVPAW